MEQVPKVLTLGPRPACFGGACYGTAINVRACAYIRLMLHALFEVQHHLCFMDKEISKSPHHIVPHCSGTLT